MSSATKSTTAEIPRLLHARERSQLLMMARVLKRDRAALLGGIFLLIVVVASLLAPILAPSDPYTIRPELRLLPPGTGPYLLGGDELGRDVLSRLLWGGRSSLVIGFVPVVSACIVGGMLGVTAGFVGGRWERIVMRVMDVFLAFPPVLLALGIAAAKGPGMGNVIVALSVVTIPAFARVVRSSTLSVREQEFTIAAVMVGAGSWRIIWRHIIPNILSPVIVLVTLQAGRMIIAGAGLSFLGLGVVPPDPDWGSMLSSGQGLLPVAPHIATIPGLMIFLVTMGLNLMGDGLRDALDPHTRIQ